MLNVKPFRQKPGLCGPVTLKMVLGYFGIVMSQNALAKLTNCSPVKGSSAEDILAAAKSLGFEGKIIDNSSLKDIKNWIHKRKIPIIVDWFSGGDGHYSVVVDIDKENIYLQDPQIGSLRALKLDEFFRLWFDFPGSFIKDKNDMILRRIIAIYPKADVKAK